MRSLPVFVTMALLAASPCMAQVVVHDGGRAAPYQSTTTYHHSDRDSVHPEHRAGQQPMTPHNEHDGYATRRDPSRGYHRDAARERAEAQHRADMARQREHRADQNNHGFFVNR